MPEPDLRARIRRATRSATTAEAAGASRARTGGAGSGAPFARPTRGQAVVAVLLALVGFAGVTQVRTNQVDDTYAGLREQDLIDILNGLAGTTQRAQRTRSSGSRPPATTCSPTPAPGRPRSRRPATGPGAQHPGRHRPGLRPGRHHHHQGGVRAGRVGPFIDMVQALRTAGAEAMQINDEVRVVAQTSFEDGTGGLLVDGRLLEAPFTVDVIGTPDDLVDALRFPDGPQDQFEEDDGAELTFAEVPDGRRRDRPGPGRG